MSHIKFRRSLVFIVSLWMLMAGVSHAQDDNQSAVKPEPPAVDAAAVAGDTAAKNDDAASSDTATKPEVEPAPAKDDAAASDSGESEMEKTEVSQSNDGDKDAVAASVQNTGAEGQDATDEADDSQKGEGESISSAPVEVEVAAGTDNAADAKEAQDADVDAVEQVDIVVAPNEAQYFTAKNVVRTDRVINILTTQTVRPGALTLTIDHRAHDSFLAGEDAFFDYLGLDAGNLKIGIGLRLGLKPYLDFGMYRLSNGPNLFDVYEFDTKVRFLKQDKQFVNMSLRIGATWFVQKNADDASGFFSQVNIDRRLFGKLLLGTGFAFHTDSTNDRKTLQDKDPSAAILGYAEWRPVQRFSLNAEMAANVAGFGSKFPIFAFAARFLTHRHAFSLVVANSQYMSADGIVSNSWRAFDELVFGFQIVREFNLKN